MCACGDSACTSERFRQSEKDAEIRSIISRASSDPAFIVPRLPVTFGGIVYMFAVYIRKLLPCFMLGSLLIATTSVSKFLAAITKLRLSKGLTMLLPLRSVISRPERRVCLHTGCHGAARDISVRAGLISHPIQTIGACLCSPACFCFQNFGRDYAGSDYKRH